MSLEHKTQESNLNGSSAHVGNEQVTTASAATAAAAAIAAASLATDTRGVEIEMKTSSNKKGSFDLLQNGEWTYTLNDPEGNISTMTNGQMLVELENALMDVDEVKTNWKKQADIMRKGVSRAEIFARLRPLPPSLRFNIFTFF